MPHIPLSYRFIQLYPHRALSSTASILTPHHVVALRCTSCLPQAFRHLNTQSFSSTTIRPKKKARKDAERAENKFADAGITDDPYDLSSLEDGIMKALERLQDELKKLRPGGRFNPELLEHLRVKLEKDGKGTSTLGSLAQVVPKGGRSVMVLVGDKDHLRPIISTINTSKLNLTPVPDPTNTLQLNISIPPPTQDSHAAVLAEVTNKGETAHHAIKMARAAMHKKLRAMAVTKKARPDDIFKAEKMMEKKTEEGNEEVKKVVREGRKVLEKG